MNRFFSHIKMQFSESAKCIRRTHTLTTVGILLAVQMVLSSFGVVELGDSMKISLDHLALAPTAIFFGPIAAMIQGGLADILGFLLKPTGPYFPGFTLSVVVSGLIYGCLFYKTDWNLGHVIAARLLVMVIVNLFMNTTFLVMLYGPAKLATFPLRVVKNVMQLPVDCLLLYAVCRTMARVPNMRPAR